MDLFRKAKENLMSILPIVIIVLILHFTIAPMPEKIGPFLIGSIFLVAGLTLFLSGADVGFSAVGARMGSALANKRNLPLILAVGFLIGFGVTYAEPDVNVLCNQVHSMNPSVNAVTLKLLIALGLGVFIDLGLLRSLKNYKLNIVLNIMYLVCFALVLFAGQAMASISFDASGSTTGPLAVPFILALGLGVSKASAGSSEDSFGLTGVASVGPVVAVLIMAVMTKGAASSQAAETAAEASSALGSVLLHVLKNTAIGIAPLLLLILVLQVSLMHFPPVKFRIICAGIFYSFVGIVLLLTGIEYGFSSLGLTLGSELGNRFDSFLVPSLLALLFGAIVVLAEPAVWVLTKQVEDVTAGRIRSMVVMVALSVGVSLCVALSVIRAYFNINYTIFIFVFVGLALILSWITPPLFVGIAFDSGGVASGPMSTSFILSMIMGISGSAEMGFGVVGMIAMSPLVAIQILGVLFRYKEKKALGQKEVK